MNIYSEKLSGTKSNLLIRNKVVASQLTLQLKDDRPKSILQKKQMQTWKGKTAVIQERNLSTEDNSGDVVQRIPLWKIAATGASIAGGVAALTAGSLAGGATLLGGGVGYAGYKGYHSYKRYKTHNAVQQELAVYDPVNNANVGLNMILNGRSQTAFIRPPGAVDGAPAGPVGDRRYRIDINQNNPTGEEQTDPDMIASAITHEKTHIANDQSYDSNAARTINMAPLNLSNAEVATRGEPTDWSEIAAQRVQRLKATVETDKQVPVQWCQYILNRLDYLVQGMNPILEYDTVINELLHFMYAKGIEADSKTAQEITRMAAENHLRR